MEDELQNTAELETESGVEEEVSEEVYDDTDDTSEEEDSRLSELEEENQRLKNELAKNKRLSKKKKEPINSKNDDVDYEAMVKEKARIYGKVFTKFDDEEVDYAEKIAKVEGISVDKAVNTDLFKVWKQTNDKRRETEKASLQASKSGGKVKKEITFSTRGLTKEQHRELHRKQMRQ